MLVTPPSFTSLVAPVAHDNPRTFTFRGYEVLVRETDFALPDATVVKSLDIAAENLFPVGLFRKEYFSTAWVSKDTQPPDGFVFKGLRALWGRMDEETIAVAGRALQISDWARTHRFCVATSPTRASRRP